MNKHYNTVHDMSRKETRAFEILLAINKRDDSSTWFVVYI
jgi:hypothetical protein